MNVVFDVETNAIVNPTRCWLIVCKDIDSGECYHFKEPDINKQPFLDFARRVDVWVGHNAIAFDYVHICALVSRDAIDPKCIRDTFILGKLLKYKLDDEQGHSIEAWGDRFGIPKLPTPDFTKYSDELAAYCTRDVDITARLYSYLCDHMADESWHRSIEVEHAMAWICLDLHNNGFAYDKEKADSLRSRLEDRLQVLDSEIKKVFLPKAKAVRVITPKLTKHGTISKANLPRDWTDLSHLHPGCSFTLLRFDEFNPGSPSQVVDRLNGFGWSPTVRTKSGDSWKLVEENFATLPETAPKAARTLIERMIIASRVRKLDEWAAAYNPQDKRIHGQFHGIGTWTGRMSHKNPNMGNVSAEKSIKYKGVALRELATKLGAEMRSLWVCTPGSWLVGTDAESIQLRIFAHYIDDPKFTEALLSGKKEDGTDPHSLNARILSCGRDTAKTFIYAFLLGAGDQKIGEILGKDATQGGQAKRDFIAAYPGLARLRKKQIPEDAKRGYFIGFDGRLVYCNDEHYMLAGYLQNGEACIMKHANILWRKELNGYIASRHGRMVWSFKQVNFVHDEWQTECYGSRDFAEEVGRLQAAAIKRVGEQFELRCPMAGQYVLGHNWLETH